jgi:hypothetical protein
MSRTNKRILIGTITLGLLASPSLVVAGSLGDFFKALGNSIAHPGQHKKSASKSPATKSKTKTKEESTEFPPSPPPVTAPTATPTATTSQPPVRPASAPPNKNSKRDIPYGIPVPNRPGFVTSPYSPKSGYVDVRGFPSGTEVKDPYSGKIFLTP